VDSGERKRIDRNMLNPLAILSTLHYQLSIKYVAPKGAEEKLAILPDIKILMLMYV
jgi:hypothetical protein